MPLSLRPGAVGRRSYPTPPCQRPGVPPGGATPSPRSGAVARGTNPTPWLLGHRRAQRSYPTLKVRKGGGEEIPLEQGKEHCLRFAVVAVKRYPTPKVRETQVRR